VKLALNRQEFAQGARSAMIGTESTTGPRYTLDLLGGFELRSSDGQTIVLPTRKAQLLLAYLALPAGHAHAREKLAMLLWGDRLDQQARGSLRNAVAAIRSALCSGVLAAERDTLALLPGNLSTDVDRLAAAGTGSIPDQQLDAMLRSQFLDGVASPSEAFDDWLAFERARCRGLAQSAAQKAIAAHEQAGRLDEAILLAKRLVALDPLREQSYRLLMRLLAASGERSQAMAQFHACRDILKRELGVEPSGETTEFARLIAAEGGTAPGLPLPAAEAAGRVTSGVAQPRGFAIAVLPFVSMAGELDRTFLAEGFSEDLITELSRRRDFTVIARQSSALFSGAPETAAVAAAELSVRYALAGSLRLAAGRLRVTVQMIDALGNRCVWADRYDRDLADIFAMQDDIVASIVGSLDAEVRHEERERAARKLPSELDAWELFHRGLWHAYRFTRDDIETAERLFRQALQHAPDFALPHAGLGYAAFVKAVWYFAPDPVAAISEGLAHTRRALLLDDGNVFCHVVFGRLLTLAGDLDRALIHLRSATEMNPSYAQAHFGLAQALIYSGEPAEALAEIEVALRLSPKDPLRSMFLTLRSFCHFSLGDYEDAVIAARLATQLQASETWSQIALIASLVELGRLDEARGAARALRSIDSGFSTERFERLVAHVPAALRERVRSHLHSAGIAAED
jgi:TolB-like protein/DNA-binding SARP family transcriptional activator/predicted Zn-dependent protease